MGAFQGREGESSRVQWLVLSVKVCTQVSGESHSWGPQSLHWPGCLSDPPQTACAAGVRSNIHKGSCSAVSFFCGSEGPIPLRVSEIAAGSERKPHLFSQRNLCCCCC